jgi:dTDP-4-dehydrorhamnose 3,5-epimerase
MIFHETELRGAFILELEKREDDRGFFARTWCQREFRQHGLNPHLAQCSISFNRRKGTLRGMHYQAAPHAEAKLVRVTRGVVYDVIIDLRPKSPTYKRHLGLELSADNYRMLYVPEGFAHGFITLAEATEVFYQMSEFFTPASTQGLRWNDPAFGVAWPVSQPILNDRDQSYPDFVS